MINHVACSIICETYLEYLHGDTYCMTRVTGVMHCMTRVTRVSCKMCHHVYKPTCRRFIDLSWSFARIVLVWYLIGVLFMNGEGLEQPAPPAPISVVSQLCGFMDRTTERTPVRICSVPRFFTICICHKVPFSP